MKMGSPEPERTSSAKDGTKMDWMYKGPAALVDRDDYLKGRSVDKSLKMLDEAEKGNKFSYADEVEKDLTPISIFSSRGSAGPIDVIRKIKEDPLFQIQKKEEEHLRQLLNNPVRMKRLRDLAEKNKKVQDKSRKSDDRKKHKKKRSKSSSSSSSSSSDDSSDDDDDGDIDKILAEKLKSMKDVKEKLMTKKTKESSSSDDEDHKKSKSSKRSKLDDRQRGEKPHSSSSTSSSRVRDSETDRDRDRDRNNRNERDQQRFERDRYRERERDHDRSSNFNSTASREDKGSHRDRDRRDRSFERGDRDNAQRNSKNYHSQPPSGRSQPRPAPQQKKPLDDAEKERRLKEMMENSKWREQQRTQNVNKHREEVKREEDKLKAENNTDFIRKQLVEAASTGSIEKRIKSNSYNIQRSKSSMNQNFAKR